MKYHHTPVMLDEIIGYLDLRPADFAIDCTFGGGGCSIAMADKILPDGKVLAIDLDKLAIENGKRIIKKKNIKNIILVQGNFRNLMEIVSQNYKEEVLNIFSVVIFDLGLSSALLEDRSRGFSFRADTPLDMRFGSSEEVSAQATINIVNNWPEHRLEEVFKNYGEEKYGKSIARSVVIARSKERIETTGQLVKIIRQAVPKNYRENRKMHFATKTFQALRIATNDELGNLEKALPQALDLLKKGGKLMVVSYHSLEDRIVKNFFKLEGSDCICPPQSPLCVCGHKAKVKIITKKPALPSAGEVVKNPRSRSAKLRVAQKL